MASRPEPGPSVSARLRSAATEVFERARMHPLILGIAADPPDRDLFERWLVVNTHFLRTYRRFLIVMGSLAPDARAAKVMFEGLRVTDLEILDARAYADRSGLDLDTAPTPRAMDFTSYCMACATQGWSRGLVLMVAIEALYEDVWSSVRPGLRPEHPFHSFIDEWSGPEPTRFVTSLYALADRVQLTEELEHVFTYGLQLEMASWDETFGQVHAH